MFQPLLMTGRINPQWKRRPKLAAGTIGRSAGSAAYPTQSERDLIKNVDVWLAGNLGVSTTRANQLGATIAYCKEYKPDFQCFIYQIPYEVRTNQIESLTRSGTTVTVVGRYTLQSISVGSSVHIKLTGTVYDGVQTVTSVNTSAKSWTFTAAGAETTGPTPITDQSGVFWAVNDDWYSRFDKASDLNAYTYKDGTIGTKRAWTTTHNAFDINMTEWAPTDGNGLTYQEWLADWGADIWFNSRCPGAHAYQDNVQSIRLDVINGGDTASGDWKRNGIPQNRNDSDVAHSHRAGQALFVSRHKALAAARDINKNIWVMANADNDLSGSGWTGVYDAALYEGAGASATIAQQRTRINGYMANLTGPKIVFYSASNPSSTDYVWVRSRHAMCLIICDAYFACRMGSTYDFTTMQDTYYAPLGIPVEESQGTARGGTNSNIIWRKYSNGIAIFNMSQSTSGTLTLGGALGTYRHIGSQDVDAGYTLKEPTFHTGANVDSITLPAYTGCILIRRG